MGKWSDESLLKKLPNPSKKPYEIKHETLELTFLGNDKKPDFARLTIFFYPGDRIVELKSLKEYFYQFRDKIISYERLINVIYNDLMSVYSPTRLRLVIKTNIRGGISSTIKIDSDKINKKPAEI